MATIFFDLFPLPINSDMVVPVCVSALVAVVAVFVAEYIRVKGDG